MEKLKIAFFSDMLIRDYDGCMRTVFHIIDRKPEDVEIKFFTGQGTVKGLNRPAVTIPNISIPRANNYKIAIPQLASRKIRREIEAFQPDVIHITTPSMLGNYALQVAQEENIPVSTIYHTHYISYIDYYLTNMKSILPLAQKFIKNITRNFYNKSDLILVPTQEMKEVLTQVDVEENKMSIWERGIDKNIFKNSKRDISCIQNITNNGKFNILFASRLVWEKNIRTLIKIYKKATQENLQVNFIIAGDGMAYQSMKEEMPNAYFLGKISQEKLGQIYASCDAFVFPSISETYGNVVLEAMASGLPCIIANGGGSKSFINHGVNGFLCEPFEESQYIHWIKTLLNDKELKKKIIDQAINDTQDYDWDTLVRSFYNQLGNLSRTKYRKKAYEISLTI